MPFEEAINCLPHKYVYTHIYEDIYIHTHICSTQEINFRDQSHGRVVKFMCSASAAQGFSSSDPGRRHGTTHQAMLRWRPTCHN